MSTPRETLEAWRLEIEAELQDLRAQLAQAQADQTQAQAAYTAAAAETHALAALLKHGEARDGTPGVLSGRLANATDEALRPRSLARGMAGARVKALTSEIDGREAALRQIARSLAPQERLRPPEVIRRKTVPVEYDPIVTSGI